MDEDKEMSDECSSLKTDKSTELETKNVQTEKHKCDLDLTLLFAKI